MSTTFDSVFDQDAELWFISLRAAGRSPSTLHGYRHTIEHFHRWLDRPLASCTRMDAMRYLEYLWARMRPASVLHHQRHLRALYGFLVMEGSLTTNPFANMRLSVPEEARPTPTVEQVEAMLSAAKGDRRAYAILVLLADCGMRRGELAAITRDDVDLTSGGAAAAREQVESAGRPPQRPRRGRSRQVAPMEAASQCAAEPARPPERWTLDDPGQLIRRACRRYSNGAISPHGLRRYFAVQWLARGGSESSLVRLAGWRDGSMIRTYTRAHAHVLADVLALEEYRRLLA